MFSLLFYHQIFSFLSTFFGNSHILFICFSFIFISWRLITLQYCSGFCHTLTRIRKIWNTSRICVSSLRRGHANLLCIVPILVYVLPKRALELTYFKIRKSNPVVKKASPEGTMILPVDGKARTDTR